MLLGNEARKGDELQPVRVARRGERVLVPFTTDDVGEADQHIDDAGVFSDLVLDRRTKTESLVGVHAEAERDAPKGDEGDENSGTMLGRRGKGGRETHSAEQT